MTACLLALFLSAPPATADAPTAEQLAAWAADIGGEDAEKQAAAYAALLKAGPLAKAHVADLVKRLDAGDRKLAVRVLGAIGPDAKTAVPALEARLAIAELPHEVDDFAVALAKIDGPKVEYARAVLMQSRRTGDSYLLGSELLTLNPQPVVGHVLTLTDDADAAVRLRAVVTLGHFGSKGVQKPATVGPALAALKGVPEALEKRFTDADPRVRAAAVGALDPLAPGHAEKAIPVVIALARDEAGRAALHRHWSVDTLRRVPGPAVEAMLPLFEDPDAAVRGWVVGALGRLGADKQLEAVLASNRPARLRAGAASALAVPRGGGVLPSVSAALTDGAFEVRLAAAVGTARVTSVGAPERARAVPVLIEACARKDAETRGEAASCLGCLGSEARAAVPTLKGLLDDKAAEVRAEAALGLAAVAPGEAAPAVPGLVELLKGDRWPTAAARALGTLGAIAKPAVPDLTAQFAAKDLALRVAAAWAVARIDTAQAPKAVEVLTALLSAPNTQPQCQLLVLEAFFELGPAARPALPALEKLLADKDAPRGGVVRAMIAVDPDATAAYDFVRAVLKSREDRNGELFENLENLGPRAKPLIPDLIAALDYSGDLRLRICAVRTLGGVGPDAKVALPALRKLAQGDPSSIVRRWADRAVDQIEAPAGR